MAQHSTGDTRPYAKEYVKWSGSPREKFLGPLVMRVPCTVVPKPTGEVIVRTKIKLGEQRKARVNMSKVKLG